MIVAADLFCGAGGTSQGLVEAAEECGHRMKLTAVNHWDRAVETHSANHPEARHLCASLDSVNPRSLYREDELDLLWASPECTHHSIARGGKPINDQSRATAWCVVRWAEALRPRIILIENVKEFMGWGPIGTNGKPIARKKGDIFRCWIKALESCGYRVEWRILCAADYGDPTTRRRLFIYCVRGNRKIVWPEPTHAPSLEGDLFHRRKMWVPARNVIDWSNKGKSIYRRKKPLAEKTMRRIMIGLQKFGIAPFVLPQQRGGKPVHSVELPISTVTTSGAHAIAEPFLVHLRGQSTAHSLNDPSPTIATSGGQHLALCEPFIIGTDHYGGNSPQVKSIDAPLSAIVTKQKHAVCEPYLIKFYGAGEAVSVHAPLDTVTTRDRFGLCQPIVDINGERYLVDILFRMLSPKELAAAQGFPTNYVFTGNTSEIVKQIGNAVPKNLAKALAKSAIAIL